MDVTFKLGNGGRTCGWVAFRPPRTRVPGATMAAGRDVPHDLATFVIEKALGIDGGFWGCVAAGATFRSLGRRRTKQGTAVIQHHLDELNEAERRVNGVSFAWRRGEPTPATEELDRMLNLWKQLPPDGELVVEWPRRAERRRQHGFRAGSGSEKGRGLSPRRRPARSSSRSR